MLVSVWAGLHNRQAELDFVDIDTDFDTRLFVDPYAIGIRQDAFSSECGQHIRSFFNALLSSIRAGDRARSEHLASHLHEAGDTCLGLSKGRPRGHGIGRQQSLEIIDALAHSRAFQTGLLTDLSDAELFIEGIGSDKISDLTTNIIRGPLLEYTKAQAELWSMPLEQNIAMGAIWDMALQDWVQAPRETIVVAGKPIILIPKYAVRRMLTLNSQEFYNNHMVEYLRSEYLRAGQALVRTLKSGERRVYKTDVKEHHPKSKPALAEFASQHPEVLEQYKRIAGAKGSLPQDDIDAGFDELSYARGLIAALREIPSGGAHASNYHSYCIGALTFLFYPELISPIKEQEIDQGRKRIDISYTNASRGGFFDMAIKSPQLRAIYVPVECNNYTGEIANPELDQLTGRFSHVRGFFGFLCCRHFDDRARFIARCKDAAFHRSQFVIALSDDDLIEMLELVASGRRGEIDGYLDRRFSELVR